MQDGEGAKQRQSCYGTRADTPGLERQSHKRKANTAIGRSTGSFVLALQWELLCVKYLSSFHFAFHCLLFVMKDGEV